MANGASQSTILIGDTGVDEADVEADDTNSSAADFTAGFFSPRPNSLAPTEVLCPLSSPPPAAGNAGGSASKKCKKKKRAKGRDARAAAKKCKKRTGKKKKK